MVEWIGYLIAGLVSGLLAGLFGIGGGLIIVPILMLVFGWQGMSSDIAIHVAIATSLMTISVTSISSMLAHHKYETTQWHLVKKLAPSLVLGSFAGAYIASSMPSHILKIWFGVFALLVAIKMWLPPPKSVSTKFLATPSIFSAGLITGIVSAMVGIGGGSLVVPYLVMSGLSMQRAVGTAAACGLPIALSGAAGYILIGSQLEHVDGQWQSGFVHWQAFLGIIATSVWVAPIGAKLAKTLPSHILSRLFSLFLFALAAFFLVR